MNEWCKSRNDSYMRGTATGLGATPEILASKEQCRSYVIKHLLIREQYYDYMSNARVKYEYIPVWVQGNEDVNMVNNAYKLSAIPEDVETFEKCETYIANALLEFQRIRSPKTLTCFQILSMICT